MELKVINEQGQASAALQASDVLFGRDFNEALVHQIVVAYQANARSGDRQQKDRSEVRHTTGRIFPNSPEENFSQKVNKKMFRAGMAAILSELARRDRLVVVDDLTVDAPKTKLFSQKLKTLGLEGSLLVITDVLSENLYLSSRNLPNVLVLEAQEADPVSLVRFAKVLVTKNAVAKFEEMWG
jgi:large subunit ribosomal protein L4